MDGALQDTHCATPSDVWVTRVQWESPSEAATRSCHLRKTQHTQGSACHPKESWGGEHGRLDTGQFPAATVATGSSLSSPVFSHPSIAPGMPTRAKAAAHLRELPWDTAGTRLQADCAHGLALLTRPGPQWCWPTHRAPPVLCCRSRGSAHRGALGREPSEGLRWPTSSAGALSPPWATPQKGPGGQELSPPFGHGMLGLITSPARVTASWVPARDGQRPGAWWARGLTSRRRQTQVSLRPAPPASGFSAQSWGSPEHRSEDGAVLQWGH